MSTPQWPEDHWYGWIVVAAAFLSNLMAIGLIYCFGIFIVPIGNTLHHLSSLNHTLVVNLV